MSKLKTLILSLAVPGLILTSGCKTSKADKHVHKWQKVETLVAVVSPTQGNQCHGAVFFRETGDGKIKVTADIKGLNPNQKHAIHIHEFGDCSAADATSAGGHYNPENHPHALPMLHTRHAGDLGNLQADASGRAVYEITVENISLVGLKNPIIGRSVIVHAKEDDGSQPTGNAGPRIGCGVIGLASQPK